MIRTITCFLFLGTILKIYPTNHLPWMGNYLEFESAYSITYQRFSYLSSGSTLRQYASNDCFIHMSIANALKPNFTLEVEGVMAWTRRQRPGMDHLKLTGRYNWQNDIIGEPLSITTGASYIQSFHSSLRDFSSFHHGLSEGEWFLSLGKECAQETEWISRWWSVAGIGFAERGSAWLRFDLNYEAKWHTHHQIKTFLHSLWGLGQHRLHLSHFHGYGAIQHQFIELGVRYTYLIDYFGSFCVEYALGVHTRNWPFQPHRLLIQLFYVFGL